MASKWQEKTQQQKASIYRSSREGQLVDNSQGPNCWLSTRILWKTPLNQTTQILNLLTRRGNKLTDFPKIEPWEVKLAVKQLKKERPGPDNITIDLIDECLRESKVPKEWNEAIIIVIYERRLQEHFQLPSNMSLKQYLQTFNPNQCKPIEQHARQESTERTSGVP